MELMKVYQGFFPGAGYRVPDSQKPINELQRVPRDPQKSAFCLFNRAPAEVLF